jgi:hypothetical protein
VVEQQELEARSRAPVPLPALFAMTTMPSVHVVEHAVCSFAIFSILTMPDAAGARRRRGRGDSSKYGDLHAVLNGGFEDGLAFFDGDGAAVDGERHGVHIRRILQVPRGD